MWAQIAENLHINVLVTRCYAAKVFLFMPRYSDYATALASVIVSIGVGPRVTFEKVMLESSSE